MSIDVQACSCGLRCRFSRNDRSGGCSPEKGRWSPPEAGLVESICASENQAPWYARSASNQEFQEQLIPCSQLRALESFPRSFLLGVSSGINVHFDILQFADLMWGEAESGRHTNSLIRGPACRSPLHIIPHDCQPLFLLLPQIPQARVLL